MVEKAVEDGGGDGAVAVEDCRPLLESFVGGEHDGAALVALEDLRRAIGVAFQPALDGGLECVELAFAPWRAPRMVGLQTEKNHGL